MWQSILRNWLLSTAQEHLRESARQKASPQEPQPAGQQPPPEPKKSVCHVGVVFALGIEAGSLIDRLSGLIRIEGAGFVAREGGLDGCRVVVIESGSGRLAAERAARALILGHQPRWIVSAGFAGGLDGRLAQGDILLADEIVDTTGRALTIDFKLSADAAASPTRVHVGRLLTMDHVVERADEKHALGKEFAALAVDMESLGVAEVCAREKVRFLSVRVIGDAVDRTLPRDIDRLVKQKSTAGRLGAAAGALLRRPGSIKDMWQLKEDALVASERLAKFLAGLIGQLK